MQDSDPLPANTPSPVPAEPGGPSLDDRKRRSALLVVFLVMFIDLLGFGIVLPLLPRYAKVFLEPLIPDGTQGAAGLRGLILGLLMASFSLMQFFFAPIWGRMSDRVGRRPFLLLGLAGSVVFYALFGVASELGEKGWLVPGLTLLFVARIGAGIAGATVSTAQAVIADTTTKEQRSRGMALIGVAFGIGFTFGPILGAVSIKYFPDHKGAPGFLAAGFSLIALIVGILRMPETWRPGVSAGRRDWISWHGVRTAFQTPTVGLLILTFFLSTFAFGNLEATLAFLTGDVLHFGDEDNLYVFAFVGMVLMLAQGGLYQTLARRGVREITFMLLGIGLMVLGLSCVAATATIALHQESAYGLLTPFLVSLTLAVIGFAFVTPSVQALVSRRSDPTRQGEILGVNQSANAIARILGPMAGASLYYLPPVHFLPYAFAVCMLVIVFFLTLRAR
jgi:MFS family permease